MYYWNKDNFEGLKGIGNEYIARKDYELFGEYCLKKEQGLKKLAVKHINDFISASRNLDAVQQRAIAEEISSLAFWNSSVHQLLSYPLEEYLKATLLGWVENEPDNYVPFKWLGYIEGSKSWYEKALLLKPDDQVCIYRLAMSYIHSIDFQTHHLDESILLGDEHEVLEELKEVEKLHERLVESKMKRLVYDEYNYYQNLVNCWLDYSSSETDISFPDWSNKRNEGFQFPVRVYYDK